MRTLFTHDRLAFLSFLLLAPGLSLRAQTGGDFQRIAVIEPTSFVKSASGNPKPNDAQLSGSLLYVAYGNGSNLTPRGALVVYNVADPANPKLVTEITFSDRYLDRLAIDGTTLYAAGLGLTVFDLSTPSSPRQITFAKTASRANGQSASLDSNEVDIFGGYVFIDDGTSGLMSLRVFNSGQSISVAGARSMQGSGYRGMVGVGNIVFSVDDYQGYFSTISANGILTATGTLNLLGDPADIALDSANGRAWVTSEALGPAYIYSVNIAAGTSVGFTVTSVIPHPGAVQYANDVLIVRDNLGNAFYTVDVSQPNTISLIKAYPNPSSTAYTGACFRFFPTPNLLVRALSYQTLEIWKPGPALTVPSITTQPAAATVTPGGDVTLTVVAAGSPTLTYQWKKGGTSIAGATNATLTLSSVTTADDATFTVTVTNLAGSVTSNGAKVTVSASAGAKPALSSATSASGTVGQSFSYTATFSGSPTSLSASGVPAGLSFNTSSGVLSGTPTAAGSYTVVFTATNAAGSGTGNLVLTIAASGGTGSKPALTSGATATATVGQAFSYTATFSGSPTSLSATGLPAGLSFNATTGSLSGTPTSSGSYSVTLSAVNAAGTGTGTLSLTVSAASTSPVQPAPAAVPNYAPPYLSAGAVIYYSGRVSDSLQGNYDDVAAFQVLSATAFTGGTYAYTRTGPVTARITYTVVTSDANGSETEEGMVLISFLSANTGTYTSSGSYRGTYKGTAYNGTFTGAGNAVYQPPSGAPSVTANPVGQIVSPGSSVTLSTSASGNASYQWQKDDVDLPGRTGSSLTLSNVQASDNGSYAALIRNSAGAVLSSSVTVGIPSTSPAPASALANLSVRTTMASGQTLIVGAVLAGGTKSVLIRGAGPALNQFGLSGLSDPKLELYTTGALPVSANDDWPSELSKVFASVGAFGFGTGSRDAAISQPISGGFTVQAKGAGSGIVLVELYDATGGTASRLINVSTRNRVGSGADVLIVGFNVSGSGTKNLLIRGIGPGLAQFGLSGALADPKVQIYDGDNTVVASNDNWDASLASTFTSVGAFGLPNGSKDAALIASLKAGVSYTVVVSGADGGTGEALVEVYELP
jgi:hypothetical protein